MTSFQRVLSSDCVLRWGWTLLHSLWQMAAVGMLAVFLLGCLHRRSANLRYVVACVALAAMFLSPLLTYSVIPSAVGPASVVASTPTRASPPLMEPTAGTAAIPRMDRAIAVAALPEPSPTDSGLPRSSRLMDMATKLFTPCVPWTVLIWLIGVMGLSTRRLGGFVAAGRLRYVGVMPVPESLARSYLELKARLRVAQPVRLVQSILVEVPVAIGSFRPVILVPVSILTGLTPQEIEAVLAHELAHVRRRDYLVNLLQTVAETLLFYHPAVWWVSRRIRIEREHCCDDTAVAACGSKVDYAKALIVIEKDRTAPEWAMAATSAKKAGATLGRVRRILGVPAPGRSQAGTWVGGMIALALVAGLAIIIPVTLAAPAAKSEPEKSSGQSEDVSAAATKQSDSRQHPKESAPVGHMQKSEQAVALAATEKPPHDVLELNIDNTGSLKVNGATVPDVDRYIADEAERIRTTAGMTAEQIACGEGLPTRVVIRAEGTTPFKVLNRVIKTCQDNGFRQFAFKVDKSLSPHSPGKLKDGQTPGFDNIGKSPIPGVHMLIISVSADPNTGTINSLRVGETSIPEIAALGEELKEVFANPGSSVDQVMVKVNGACRCDELMKIVEICTHQTLPEGKKLAKLSFVMLPSD